MRCSAVTWLLSPLTCFLAASSRVLVLSYLLTSLSTWLLSFVSSFWTVAADGLGLASAPAVDRMRAAATPRAPTLPSRLGRPSREYQDVTGELLSLRLPG